MGAIKDVLDLTVQLINSVKDREVTAKITAIQSLIHTVQSENFSVIEKNTQLLTENSALKKVNSELEIKHRNEMAELEAMHAHIEAQLKAEIKKLKDRSLSNVNLPKGTWDAIKGD